MEIPDAWSTQARAWLGKVSGRTAWAVATPDGVVASQAMDDDATLGDAALAVVHVLRTQLSHLGVDFGTNHVPLRQVIAADRTVAGPHVSIADPALCPPGDTTMTIAQDEAARAVAERGGVWLLAATDGSRRGREGGWGWVTENGQSGRGWIISSSPLESELVAIEKLLAGTSADQPLLVVSDSTHAIVRAREALAGQEPPEGTTKAHRIVLARLRAHAGREVQIEWVKGHNGHALNVAADKLAGLGRHGEDQYGPSLEEMAARAVSEAMAAIAAAGRDSCLPHAS